MVRGSLMEEEEKSNLGDEEEKQEAQKKHEYNRQNSRKLKS